MITMPLGAYQTNCYILWEEGSEKCAVIDPGDEAQQVLLRVKGLGKTVEAILLTHGHFDHVGAVRQLAAETGCRIWMAQGDYSQHKTRESDFFYPLHDWDCAEVNFCEEAQVIQAGGLSFTVMQTPGHTWGCCCYVCQEHIFSGDTLFQGSCGRTDLPGGDWLTIKKSLGRLAKIEGNLWVYPGHGGSTTLAQEKQYNPYMR
jgi:glyoxylase-like metal-dependent hydrolase (beta-lactamase superfamily II)